MTDSIIAISHGFFDTHIGPVLQRQFPDEFAQMAFGVWGLGSEALGLDDEYSRDHHWGLRIDTLMPAELFQTRRQAMLEVLNAELPASYQGHSLGEQAVTGAGINPEPARLGEERWSHGLAGTALSSAGQAGHLSASDRLAAQPRPV